MCYDEVLTTLAFRKILNFGNKLFIKQVYRLYFSLSISFVRNLLNKRDLYFSSMERSLNFQNLLIGQGRRVI